MKWSGNSFLQAGIYFQQVSSFTFILQGYPYCREMCKIVEACQSRDSDSLTLCKINLNM